MAEVILSTVVSEPKAFSASEKKATSVSEA